MKQTNADSQEISMNISCHIRKTENLWQQSLDAVIYVCWVYDLFPCSAEEGNINTSLYLIIVIYT